jgi:tetratricopeptide (TPR) repeat protein
MVIALESRIKKLLVAGLASVAAISYITISACNVLAAHFSDKEDRHALQWAVRLAPGSADYQHRLGMSFFEDRDLQHALEHVATATSLNPHDAHYWLDLANVERALGNNHDSSALQHALAANPSDPELAWESANNFMVQGDVRRTLQEFRIVMQAAPGRAYESLQRCLHVADVNTVLAQALPPQPEAYLAFVDLLSTQKNSSGAAEAWDALVQLRRPVDTGRALQYINYLIQQREVSQALRVWNETLQLNGLSSYLTGHENLVVNPSFDADILNGGFDWRYRRHANVELALDPSDFHAGRRSLAVSFDGPGISDAGIFQLMPVDPETTYEFSAYFKSDQVDGAGGPRLAIEDAYTGASYFQSDDLKNSEIWRQVAGQFKTQPDTQLVVLRLIRVPQDSPIRGKLWVENFHLSEKEP